MNLKEILVAYQKRVGGRTQTMLCATCPKKRAQAQGWVQEARQERDKRLKELERKKEALLKEALAWAVAK